ncbi:5888_t:CDS:2, partial [Entrophospora sp. SA101]
LERSAKENEERFAKLEQRQLQDDARSAVFPTLKSLVNTVPTEIVNSNDIPASEIIITSDTSNSDDTSEPNNVSVSDVSNNVSNSDEPNNVSASDISDNTLNSDVCLEETKSRVSDIPLTRCFASPIPAETISLEEKEENEFLNLQYKDRISKEITERIREKKLQDQEKIITSQDTKSSLSVKELERSAKENEERFAKLEQRQLQDDARSAVFPTLKSLVNTVPTEIVNSNDIPASEIIITSDTSNSDDTSEPNNVSVSDVSNNVSNSDEPNNVSASDISDNTLNSDVCLEETKSRVSDIPLTRCFASPIPAETISLEEKEENEFLNLQYKDRISKEITERIREKKLQDQEKIITSQDTKSSLNESITTTSSVPLVHTSNSEDKISEKVKSLPEEEVSISQPKTLPEKQNNPTHLMTAPGKDNHISFRRKVLDQYPDIFYEFNDENIDYYGIGDDASCPLCKLDHDGEEGIKGEYKDETYYIKSKSDKVLAPEYLNWYSKLTDLPTTISDKLRSKLYKIYKKKTGLDPWIMSETPEPPQIEKTDNYLSQDCVIKISKFPEEKSTIHEAVHKRFPFLSYTNSNAWHRDVFKYTDSEAKCPVCKEVHTHRGIWGDWSCLGKDNHYFLNCPFRIDQKKVITAIQSLHESVSNKPRETEPPEQVPK